MSGIQARNTKPEIIVRKALFRAGFRFRLHRKDLPGTPDIVLPGRGVVIFVHGCFWHVHEGCRYAKMPTSRRDFWERKLSANVSRDCHNRYALLAAGWRVLVVWECATRSAHIRDALPDLLGHWINGSERTGELGSINTSTIL
ncbi:very short patch repair endonuclease [Ectothiorhodospira sp. 9100]|nr:very short patch repair endonuclease [Ectothiorhodospira sp. 9100]MCG5519954.1 very short patch repair endonuclease [Ectothiorhodospira sp. 9905]